MSHTTRDDFSAAAIRTLGLRAGYFCSNPDCRKPTSLAHSDPTKAIVTGEACHICAASPGGPRYDAAQTAEQRKDILNAIWLCAVCSKKIDTDWRDYPREKLLQLKTEHEQWIASQQMIPSLPAISLETLPGLRTHERLGAVTAELLALLREHELIVRNPNRVDILNLKMEMCLPEAVRFYGHFEKNAATHVQAKPRHSPWIVMGVNPGGHVAELPAQATPHHSLEVPSLSGGARVKIAFYTTTCWTPMRIEDGKQIPIENPDAVVPKNELRFYLEGTYQFILRGEYVASGFFVPLIYSYTERTVKSLPIQESSEPWNVIRTLLFPGFQLQT